MADLKVGIVLRAFDRTTAPLKSHARSAGATKAALAKLDASRKETAEPGREFKRAENAGEKLRKAFERSQGRIMGV